MLVCVLTSTETHSAYNDEAYSCGIPLKNLKLVLKLRKVATLTLARALFCQLLRSMYGTILPVHVHDYMYLYVTPKPTVDQKYAPSAQCGE